LIIEALSIYQKTKTESIISLNPGIRRQKTRGKRETLVILGTTDRRAKSLWLSFCLLFLSDTIFLEAGDEAAPSGELESYDPEMASSKGQLLFF